MLKFLFDVFETLDNLILISRPTLENRTNKFRFKIFSVKCYYNFFVPGLQVP